MTQLSTQPYKGARDFYPEDKRRQKYIFKIIRKVVESYGYEEYDAPILEPIELFMVKGNEEIINEQTYSFKDRGDRAVTIRTEMTPSVSRMVAAKRQELPYPLRWYSIPNLWRYERPQRGRSREFFQLNVDIFGVEGLAADHEIIMVADSIMRSLGAKSDMYKIQISSRKLVNALMHDYLGLDDTQAVALIRLIDKMHKMDKAAFGVLVEAVLSPSQRESGLVVKLLEVLSSKTLLDLPDMLQGHAAVVQLKLLMDLLQKGGVSNAVFDITLMRGFDYYTDIVFEVFDTHPDNNRSLFGGGRYDGLVGSFGVDPVPTVGFGMGDIGLENFLETHALLPRLAPETDAYVILVGSIYDKSQALLQELRREGVKLAVDTTGRKIDKQIKTASKKGIAHILFIGEEELESQRYKLKNLRTGEEKDLGLPRLVTQLIDHRTKPPTETDDLV